MSVAKLAGSATYLASLEPHSYEAYYLFELNFENYLFVLKCCLFGLNFEMRNLN